MYGLRATENPDTNVYDASGNVVPEDYNTTYGSVSGGTYPPSPAQPFSTQATSWLKANGTTVALGGGALLVLLLVAKAGR